MQVKMSRFLLCPLLACMLTQMVYAGGPVDWLGTKCTSVEDTDGRKIYDVDHKKSEFVNVKTFPRGICNANMEQNIQDNDTCVKLTGVSVQNMPQAIQIAKDYVKERYGHNIICHPNIFSCKDRDDHILCKTGGTQNPTSYEFVFDQIKVKDSKKYKKGIGEAYCKIYLSDESYVDEYCTGAYNPADYGGAAVLHSGAQMTTCKTYDQGLLCYTPIKNRTNNVSKLNNNLLSNFGYTAKDLNNGTNQARDAVYVNFQEYDTCDSISIGNLNKRFQSLKMNLDLQTVAWLASYIGREKQGQLKTFKCDLAAHSCINKVGILKIHKKDVLTCYADNERIDFLFDTLSTHRRTQEQGAWSAMQCMTNTTDGIFDGRRCLGISKDVCLSSDFQSKITGGTRWDDNLQACVLKAANTAANWRRAEEITVTVGTSAVVLAGVVITTVVSGGVTLPVVIALTSSTLSVGATVASEITTGNIRDVVDKYNGELIRCNNAQCAHDLFNRYFNEISYYLDYVDSSVIDAMDEILSKKLDLMIESDKVAFLQSLSKVENRTFYERHLKDDTVPPLVKDKFAFDAIGVIADFIPISQSIIYSIKGVFTKLPKTGAALALKTSKLAKSAGDADTIKDIILFYSSY